MWLKTNPQLFCLVVYIVRSRSCISLSKKVQVLLPYSLVDTEIKFSWSLQD